LTKLTGTGQPVPAGGRAHRNRSAKTGLAQCCPITSRVKGYPFEVVLPDGLPVASVVLADPIRKRNWKARRAGMGAAAPPAVAAEGLGRIAPLLT
jgi:mRNA interferase MazF